MALIFTEKMTEEVCGCVCVHKNNVTNGLGCQKIKRRYLTLSNQETSLCKYSITEMWGTYMRNR